MFAFDADNVVGLIFVLVAIIGWIVNLVSGKQKGGIGPAPPKPRPPARPRDEKLQKEIDVFLDEVRPGAARQKSPQPQRSSERKTQQPAAKSSQKKSAAAASSEQPARRRPPGGDVSSRAAPVSKDLGTGVRSHVAEHLQSGKITQEVSQDLKDRVSESVTTHLGQFSGSSSSPTAPEQPTAAQQIGQLLRSPASVRQAMLINTILSPPLGRRK